MLDIQDKAYTFTIKMFVDDIKSKVNDIKKEVDELKQSVNFVSANHDDTNKQFEKTDNEIRSVYSQINILCRTMDNGFEVLGFKYEYLENQSRCDNIKIVGVEEKISEKTWDDAKEIVKKIIKVKLGMDDVVIERAH